MIVIYRIYDLIWFKEEDRNFQMISILIRTGRGMVRLNVRMKRPFIRRIKSYGGNKVSAGHEINPTQKVLARKIVPHQQS